MHSHLLQCQNCVYIGTKTAKDARYAVNNIDEVRTYSVLGPKSGESEHVQLICLTTQRCERQRCSWHCQEEIINGYHSTVVLNYMTGTQAGSLFPQSTFIRRKIYLQTPLVKGFKKRAVEKHVERGWRVADVLPSEDRKILHPLRKGRYIGDKLCWRIQYGVEGLSRKPNGENEDCDINPGSHDERSSQGKNTRPLWWTMTTHNFSEWHEIPDSLHIPYLENDPNYRVPRHSATRTHFYRSVPMGVLDTLGEWKW